MKKRTVRIGVGTQQPVDVTYCRGNKMDYQLLIPEFINQLFKNEKEL